MSGNHLVISLLIPVENISICLKLKAHIQICFLFIFSFLTFLIHNKYNYRSFSTFPIQKRNKQKFPFLFLKRSIIQQTSLFFYISLRDESAESNSARQRARWRLSFCCTVGVLVSVYAKISLSEKNKTKNTPSKNRACTVKIKFFSFAKSFLIFC